MNTATIEAPAYVQPTAETRNAPCPCGGARKLKKCCGTPAKASALREWQAEQKRVERERRYQEHLREQEERMKNPRLHGGTSFAAVMGLTAALAHAPMSMTPARRRYPRK
jgi:hypothetical protein